MAQNWTKGVSGFVAIPPEQRFWEKVEITEECWNWTACINVWGYGHFFYEGKVGRAHRFSYELHKGKIPDGLSLDHLCRNPKCVNPDHLEAVPIKVNILRGNNPAARQARQTHCQSGHEFSEENTIVSKSGRRTCRICLRVYRKKNKKNWPSSRRVY